jgi:hypothetical protein
MRPIAINRKNFSECFWRSIFQHQFLRSVSYKRALLEEADAADRFRADADYDTGSISAASVWALYCLTRLLQPKVIAEVGTFIGRSTNAFMRGIEAAGDRGLVVTCDGSNDIVIPAVGDVRLVQFRRSSSTEMFGWLARNGICADLVSLDGRLQQADLELLSTVTKAETVYVLDDFEGLEKGVSNAAALLKLLNGANQLIYPPSDRLLYEYGLRDGSAIALIMPMSVLKFTAQ